MVVWIGRRPAVKTPVTEELEVVPRTRPYERFICGAHQIEERAGRSVAAGVQMRERGNRSGINKWQLLQALREVLEKQDLLDARPLDELLLTHRLVLRRN